MPASLNFVLIGAANPLLQKAFESVLHPLTRIAEGRRAVSHSIGRSVLEAEYQQQSGQGRGMAAQGPDATSDELRAVAGKFRGEMWPELLLERITPRRLQDALQQCADVSLLLGPGQIDAADHWHRLKLSERRELATVLRQSWHCHASGVTGITAADSPADPLANEP